ncbi:MAG: N-acetylneuraminate synthase [Deltaproteobacteria bacterium RIFCSPLOWO2_01_44_7]|nr:MAG: N-acetylneuraminate synthase [Deltaproteobacteria bacterium RIFCSPHIGHO2_01_FULL_43_49]OGQ16111.1 MAG: N-acetylneuraminate synthase [Deltaproteobacteria bacterium RIFCSPHIGHO2_02_FULL_44_53]OGQ29072.1 MAG: N-acetylneuraminate synthase [Deltaproteobacteria bacterium RIFCSPHIGHO2_12_FULL_44_21]OGQ32628.1 MAG: N-acetylneuraminate synthase [Deltaproteobacteria bacterium RIFCSPLOWO2_01_FULL_45_74]OGQ41729.1 MAG: N-acetylneuraminate synthase [Deltaproteobacteria bacterium RIFCSPLOWO2_02_FULL_
MTSLYDSICRLNRPYLIAEAGVNHNGNINLAYRLIDAAKQSGADAVKFQIFKTENLLTLSAPLAEYQKKEGLVSQFEMAKQLELSFDDFKALKNYSEKVGITFLSTPDDEESLEFLNGLGVALIKIGSGEVTNLPFLRLVAKTKKFIILSTGMSTLEEVQEAVKAIFNEGNQQLILLHCVSAYPAPVEQIHLRAMETLKTTFKLPVGFSDHTLGISISLAAAALGAKVIEKHLTIDKNLSGPDHASSLNPAEMKSLAEGLAQVAMALGNGVKKPAPCEINTKTVVRKSIVVNKDLKKGDIISALDLACKRPGNGIAPKYLDKIVGLKVKKTIKKDTLLTWDMLQ